MTCGGSYRFVDLALTNLANLRGLDRVGILTQYRPSPLVEHVGIGLPWKIVGTEPGAGAEHLAGSVAAGRTIRLPMRWSRSSEP